MDFLDIAFADPQPPTEAPTAFRPDPEANPAPVLPARSTPPQHPYRRANAGPVVAMAYGMAWKARTVTVKGVSTRILTANPSGTFWQAWRSQKRAMKEAGYSVGCYLGIWEASNWQGTAVEI